jgi:hypothetical protein
MEPDTFYGQVDSEGSDLHRIPTSELIHDIPNQDLLQLTNDGYIQPKSELNDYFYHQFGEAGSISVVNLPPPAVQERNELPSLAEIDTDYRFDVRLPLQNSEKGSWVYSAKLNKIFIKTKYDLNISTVFDNPANEPLFLRAMLVPTHIEKAKDSLVLCPNHRQNQPDLHILRCTKEDCTYEGTENGYYTHDRLSVVAPLSNMASNEPLCFQFLCQNSCTGGINRRSTSIIFTLENKNREILGKRTKNIKICSCPKRDKEKEELALVEFGMPKKRKPDQPEEFSRSNIPKKIPKIKREPAELQKSDSAGSGEFQMIKLEIPLGSRRSACSILDSAYNWVTTELHETSDALKRDHLKKCQLEISNKKSKSIFDYFSGFLNNRFPCLFRGVKEPRSAGVNIRE